MATLKHPIREAERYLEHALAKRELKEKSYTHAKII